MLVKDRIIQEFSDYRRLLLIVVSSITGLYFVYLASVSPLLAFLQLSITLIIIIILLRPEVGFLIALLVMPFKNISFIINTGGLLEYFYFYQIFLLAVAAGWFLKKIIEKRERYDGVSISLPIALFTVLSMLSLFWSQDYYHAMFQILRLVFCIFLFYLMIYMARDEAAVKRIFFVIITAALIIGIGAIVSLELVTPLKWRYTVENYFWLEAGFKSSTEIRAGGFASHNQVGFFSNLGIFFTLGALFSSKSILKRILLFIVFFTICYGLFLTRSRGAEISLTVALIAFFVINHQTRDYLKRHFIKTVFFVMLFVIFVFVVSQLDRLDLELMRLTSTFETSTNEASFERRLIIWSEGIVQLVRSYGFGTGIGGFKQYVLPWPHAHSLYFSPLFDLGLPGMLIWIWLICMLLNKLYGAFVFLDRSKYKYYFKGLVAALVALSIHGLVDFEYINENIWFVAGLGLAIINLMRIEENDQ